MSKIADELIREIKRVQKTKVKDKIDSRLKQFKAFKNKPNEDWFCELCFCILTSNSKAKTAIAIQKELGKEGFLCSTKECVCNTIKRNKHRFHNNKSNFIVLAREYSNIKDIITKEKEPREWLVNNIKGLGFKESSHFLRNVGYFNYAIVDRHVVNILNEHKMIKKPKTMTKKIYLKIEKILEKLSKKLLMSQAELDMYLWYMKTGEVLK